jgi:hypothetical protein
MYLAYSALQSPAETTGKNPNHHETEMQLRYQAYHAVCNKYNHHIAAIQQYFPNWVPRPPAR